MQGPVPPQMLAVNKMVSRFSNTTVELKIIYKSLNFVQDRLPNVQDHKTA